MNEKIEFRKANESDIIKIRNWIKNNEFVKKWYYKGIVPKFKTLERKIIKRQEIKNFYSFIIVFNDVDIGYIQSYDVDGWGTWSRKVKIFDNTVSLDYFIGDINYIHRGYGKIIILEFIKQKILNSKYKYVTITPDVNNLVNCRLCEKCGFKLEKIINVPYKNSKEKDAIYLNKI